MIKLTFSIIFGLILVSGKPCYSDSTEKIINVKCATCHGLQGISKGAGYLIWQDNLKATSRSS